MLKITATSLLSLVLAGCLDKPSFLKTGTANMSQGSAPVLVATIDQDGGTMGVISAGAGGAQILTASAASGVEGAQVSFPPGAVTIDTSITMTEGEPLASNSDVASALGLGSGTVSSSGAAVAILSEQKIDAASPFTVAIAAPSGAGLTMGSSSFAIVYKVYHAFEDKTVVGIIPASEISVVDGVLTFKTKYFGVYQVITTTVEVKAVTVETKAPVQTKAQVVASQPPATATKTATDSGTGTGTTTTSTASKVKILAVSSPTGGKDFVAGDHILIDVRFSDRVTISANTVLFLYMNTGPGKKATSLPAVNAYVVRFDYTVSAGDLTPDLDYASANSLVVAGGTAPKDGEGKTPLLTLPAPGTPGSLGAYSPFVIDTGWTSAEVPANLALAGRESAVIVYDEQTGSVLVWGGSNGKGFHDGFIYHPDSNSFALTATATAPSPRYGNAYAWTGSKLLIWGGQDAGPNFGDGSLYDPADGSWTAMETSLLSARSWATAVWTGSHAIFWGGYDSGNDGDGATYDPSAAPGTKWQNLKSGTNPDPRAHQRAAWDPVNHRMFVWGGHTGGMGGVVNTGGVYDDRASCTSDCWQLTTTTGAPAPRAGHVVALAGSKFLVFGGSAEFNGFANGGLYDPDSGTWTTVTAPSEVGERIGALAVWDPDHRRVIIYGGQDFAGNRQDSAFAFDPDQGTWTPLSTKNAPPGCNGTSGVFGGGSVYFFGGNCPAGMSKTISRLTLP